MSGSLSVDSQCRTLSSDRAEMQGTAINPPDSMFRKINSPYKQSNFYLPGLPLRELRISGSSSADRALILHSTALMGILTNWLPYTLFVPVDG